MGDTGDSIHAENAGWSFGGDTSKYFDEHVARSIPLYHEGHDVIAKIADFFLSEGSKCYELGCSTGALTYTLARRHQSKNVHILAVDKEPEMIRRTEERCRALKNVTVSTADIMDTEFEKADLIISYYTMQFVKPKHRQVIFNRIYEALNWGGGFILFEKVRGPDARFQDMMTTIYTDYKLDQGYQPDEIIAKLRSLKGVLEPFSTQGNIDLMKRAGFVDIMTVVKYLCFEGFLAIK
ncbi:MAG: methyltransferase domain-containing protein [Candidatus Omnitrophica bacterium]|nr:methyltransferase domain-containing protein [Candidatus Omnitrophota bacterium]MCB9720111.1 methyltransferase domain-containing protein [Candidatus Omnitrophota bacterium]